METADDTDSLTNVVRRIVRREIELLDAMPMLGEDGLDRLAKCALILQRVRRPASAGAGENEEPSTERLMKVAK